MDPTNTVLGRMLTEEITPVVMVLRTPQVEEVCKKNGLNLIQMLSPFSYFDNIDVPVRTASDQPYRLQKFKLRLFYASDIRKPNLEAAKEQLNEVVRKAGEDEASDLCSEQPSIENILTNSKSGLLPAWFQVFNKELARTTSFSDHETFDHPVACLLVVSSNDQDPISKFVDLFNTSQLPSILNDGVMDPKVLKHYLLLHDNKEGPAEIASQVLSEMKNTFGSNDCQILCINSLQGGSVETEENPWASYQDLGDSVAQRPGCCLSIDDIDEIKLLMQDLSSKHIIPNMEQKIRLLNQQVSATRKGFRNQIKNLWWRKGKEETAISPDGPMYTYSSTESQIRVLGDYAFMLRDYELALSNYRLISTDYKLDKAWKRYAGIQEIMGLAYFMLDQSRKEAEYCMETAFSTYLKVGLNTKQNAIRCGLWWVEMLKAWDQFKEAAGVYFRISGEESLQSAVMLEQASYCYLFASPPMLRKYGFHLIMSGDQYRKHDQMKHAIRTYRTALSVFKGTSWSSIQNHIHLQLGRWFAFLGMYDVAIEHMLETLACTDQSKSTQELFLQDFLQVVQKTGKSFEVWELQLPVVKLPSVRVVFEDHRTYASPAAVVVKETVWQNLEEDVIPSLSNARANWLELQTKLVPRRLKESNMCVAGEAIKVDISFRNPLQIPISVSSVSLICKHFGSVNDIETDEHNSASDAELEEELRKLLSREDFNAENSSFTLSEADFTLGGNETLVVQLTVTPRLEGILKIIGVRWKLSSSVLGFQSFDFSQVKTRTAKGRRRSKRSSNSELQFLVIKSLPRLEGFVRQLPRKSYYGELLRPVLELSNHSDLPVKNVKMKISCPRFLISGDRDVLDMDFPAYLLKERSERSADVVTTSATSSFFQFPEDLVIQGTQPFTWPLWLRSAVPGPTVMYIAIYYEVGDQSGIMKYRTLRMCYNLEVVPSLDVSFKLSQCPSRSQEVLLRMDIVNKTSSQSFQVQQLSAVGDQWQLKMLQPADTQLQQIMAGQAFSCFLKLKNVRKPARSDGIEPVDASSSGSHVRLSTQASHGELFDIYSAPVADFHCLERFHQRTSDQGDLNAVDFVLIYQPLISGEQQVSDQSRLFAHYSCYCSIASTSPIYWLMEGPRTIHHDFSLSFCEINLKMSIHNSLDSSISVRIATYDSSPSTSQPSEINAASLENHTGWHDVSLPSNVKSPSEIIGTHAGKREPVESVTPFIWSGTSSTRLELGPCSTAEVPLQICVFTPGTYDLSSYNLHWNLLSSEDQSPVTEGKQCAGTCPGRSFFIAVFQST